MLKIQLEIYHDLDHHTHPTPQVSTEIGGGDASLIENH